MKTIILDSIAIVTTLWVAISDWETTMKVILGSNEVIDCAAVLVVNNEEVFRLRERLGDGRLVCDFDIRDKSGDRLAKIAKNNVVYAAEGYMFKNLARRSFIESPSGEEIASVEEIAMDTIKILGVFCIEGFEIKITEDELRFPVGTLKGIKVAGYNKAISLDSNSFEIGVR